MASLTRRILLFSLILLLNACVLHPHYLFDGGHGGYHYDGGRGYYDGNHHHGGHRRGSYGHHDWGRH